MVEEPSGSSALSSNIVSMQSSNAADAGLSAQEGQSAATLSHSKRKADSIPANDRPRKVRSCQKCGRLGCAGSFTRSYCNSPCQDCGKMECLGRNSHHPKKDCQTGWKLYHQKLKDKVV